MSAQDGLAFGVFKSTESTWYTVETPFACSYSSDCSSRQGGQWRWNFEEVPLGECEAGETSRRLQSVMDMEELIPVLEDLGAQGWNFPGMIYLGRVIDFNYFLDGTPLGFAATTLHRMSEVAVPFSHHLLLFPLGPNGTVASAAAKVLGIGNSSKISHLLIHLQRSGASARFVSLRIQNHRNYTHVGGIETAWVTPSLARMGKEPFSTVSWNCHHFAVALFEDIAHACKTSGKQQCPPEHVKDVFPRELSPTWCLPCQAFAVTGSAIGLATLLAGFSYKLLKMFAIAQ